MAATDDAADPFAPAPERGAPAALVLGAAAAGGLSVMSVELAAVRLLAPWFGTSQTVWTNVIGVVLLALAIGYLLGARLAQGPAPARRLGWLLTASAVAVAFLPHGTSALGAALVPAELTLEQIAGLVQLGSLGAALALFLVPATLLGAAGPLAVESLQRRRGGHAGTAGGHVLAASTTASLVGAFGTSHVALPYLGLVGTFAAAAGLLAAAGLSLLLRTASHRAAAWAALLAPLSVGGALLAEAAPTRLAEGRRLLEQVESPYQRVLAVEEGEGENRRRFLQVNEGADSFQSVWQPEPGLLGEGFYYDDFALPAHWSALEDPAPRPWRVAVLGLGAGTAWRVIEGASPAGFELFGLGAEIDPAVVELGRRWFDLAPPGDPTRVVLDGVDGRLALRLAGADFDLVIVDAYANQHQLPPHLVTAEFFAELRERLAPGGWVALNLGCFDLDDPLLPAVGETLAHAFQSPVLALAVPLARNAVLFARRDGPLPDPTAPPDGFEPGPLRARLEKARLPGAHRVIAVPAAAPLRDGFGPLEPLERASLAYGRRRTAP